MDLEQARNRYLARVSDPRYTISLPMATYLDKLIQERRPSRALDLGSGLSSSILRAGVNDAWSVEEDDRWRDVTRAWLADEGQDGTRLYSWAEFDAQDHGRFDLVLLDAGYETHRMQLLRKAVGLVADGGVLVIDDGHFPALHRCCKVYAKIQGYEFADVRDITDEYGRFPMRMDITHEPVQQDVSVVVDILRAVTCYDEAFIAFMRIAQQGWALGDMPYTMIHFARERFAKHLLEHPEFTHCVMLDQDHVHPPDIVQRLAQHVKDDRNKWVVAALNYRRGMPYDPVGYWENQDTGQYYTVPPSQWGEKLREVDVVGLSAAIIARECFEAFGPTWFGMTFDKADQNSYPGEDTCFSRRAKEAGVRLWVDPTLTSPHLKFEHVDRAYFERWVHENQNEIDDEGNITIDKERLPKRGYGVPRR